MSTPNGFIDKPEPDDKSREPEQGIRKAGRPAAPSKAYEQGQSSAEALLRLLEAGIATHGALRQAMHEVTLHGQPDRVAGFCDTLQAEVERLQGRDEAEC